MMQHGIMMKPREEEQYTTPRLILLAPTTS